MLYLLAVITITTCRLFSKVKSGFLCMWVFIFSFFPKDKSICISFFSTAIEILEPVWWSIPLIPTLSRKAARRSRSSWGCVASSSPVLAAEWDAISINKQINKKELGRGGGEWRRRKKKKISRQNPFPKNSWKLRKVYFQIDS